MGSAMRKKMTMAGVIPKEDPRVAGGWHVGRVNHYKIEHKIDHGFSLWEWTEGEKEPHCLEGPWAYREQAMERMRYWSSINQTATEVLDKLVP
jgi:hypothetical protein